MVPYPPRTNRTSVDVRTSDAIAHVAICTGMRETEQQVRPILETHRNFWDYLEPKRFSQAYLNGIALRLNQRPRKTLAFETPANRLQLVLH